MRRTIHILLVADEGLARDGLRALLRERGMLVVGVFGCARDALRADLYHTPHVTIIEAAVAMRPGPHTLAHLKRRWPATPLLVIGGGERASFEAARSAGADGYVLHNDRRAELFNALDALVQRRPYFSTTLAEPAGADATVTPLHRVRGDALLTAREQEVVRLIAGGYRTREMAQILSLSHKTIERHRTNLMRKLGVRSATGVVAYAITHRCVGF